MNSTCNLQSSKNTTAYMILKEISKFVVSYFVLSSFFSDPYWLPFFLRSLLSHISMPHWQLPSGVDDKKCVFLVCNVIIVILTKSAIRQPNSPPQPSPEAVQTVPEIPVQCTLHPKCYESLQPLELTPCTINNRELIKYVVEEEIVEEKVAFEEVDENIKGEQTMQDDESGGIVEDDDEEGNECYDWLAKEEVEEESTARISAEELNRRCEEFIRRIKEGIRIEAQHHLIMV